MVMGTLFLSVAVGVENGFHGSEGLGRDERWMIAVDHFRKHIEPKLIEDIATLLYRDLLRYKRRIRRAPLSEEPTGDTPSIMEQDFTHQEELVSRIWQRVYGWRAELIAVGRLSGQPGYESQAEDHRQAAGREEAALRRLLNEYAETYGKEFVRHGEAEYAAEGLAKLTGMSN